MKQNSQETIREVLRMVVSTPIPIRWKSGEVMPGSGERKSFFRGSNGYDIQARVEYEPGDDPRDIDWAATAQTGGETMYVTQYMEPRDLTVTILADVSPTMDFGTHRTTKRILSAELAGSAIQSAKKTHDRVGFMAYSRHNVVATQRTMGAHSSLFPTIAKIIESDGTAGGEGSGLVKSLSALPRQRSLVFVISDFIGVTDEEKRALTRAALIHDVVCLVVRDLRERELPAGWGLYTVKDLGGDERLAVPLTRRTRREFEASRRREDEDLFGFFKQAHCDSALFSTEEGVDALSRVMRLFGGHHK